MDKSGIIKWNGQEYKLVFNLNVMEQLQEEYGSVEEWGNLTDGVDAQGNRIEPNAKATIYGITAMLNEGILIENEDNEDNEDYKPRKLLTLRKVGRLITDIGMNEASKQMTQTVIESTKSDEKN